MVLLGALGLLFFACSPIEDRAPPNLLILSVDTLRADALGFDGNERARTPALDRLAGKGVSFSRTIAPMPRTTPALASLLTGLWPQNHGSREVGDPLLHGATLAEVLADRGYSTLAVNANAAAGPKQNLDRGFERFVDYVELVDLYGNHLNPYEIEVPEDGVGAAAAVSLQGLAALESRAGDRPFFLWLHYQDPHFLYAPPGDWQRGIAAEGCRELYAHYSVHRSEAGQIFSDVGGVAGRALEGCRRLYEAEIAYTDHQIGALLEALEKRGRRENTVIVFTADHGENFGEEGLFFEHGNNVHDAGIRVPLVFAGPGIEAGRFDGGAVSLVDVMPTVLALLGIPEKEWPEMDGVDLSPRLVPGGEPSRRDLARIVFAESGTAMWNEAVNLVTTGRAGGRLCINGKRFTLCRGAGRPPESWALYDHQADPKLESNVIGRHPEEVADLGEAWTNWPPESARQRAARTARFKLVQRPRLAGGYDNFLYDLETDPGESIDVAARFPETEERLAAALEDWTSNLPRSIERQGDSEIEETLRSLGYLR